MKWFGFSFKEKRDEQINKIDPIVRMWIFGGVVVILSVFANYKIIPALLLFLIVMTVSNYKSLKNNYEKQKEDCLISMEKILEEIEIYEEHNEQNGLTIEEKKELTLLEDNLEQLNILLFEIENKEIKLKQHFEKIKNFFIKTKKSGSI